MASHAQRDSSDTKLLRVAAGRWLKGLREARSLTQREMADLVGLRYYTFISQIEGGHGRIPPDQYQGWADALGIDHKTFASEIMRYYDPVYYQMLFGPGKVRTDDLPAEDVTDYAAAKSRPA
jgi:transcriptional regulator with XRE-family HTH domain